MTEAVIKVSDMVITDEFDTVTEEDSVRQTTEKLLGIPKGVIIVTSPDNQVSGVITSKEILQVVARGDDPNEINAQAIMDTDIMEVTESEDIENLVEKMKERKPHAVVVVNSEGVFKGYFSPNDYREALAKLHQAGNVDYRGVLTKLMKKKD